jgi:uncharacterized protein (TIGR02996 family)
MIEDEGLYRAILDDPDGDMPRLVYADWLEEQGDSDRAEFIRVQCELAGFPPILPDKAALRARARLCDRSRRLEAQHRAEWLGPFGPLIEAGEIGAEFRRGFVGHVWFRTDRDHLEPHRRPGFWRRWDEDRGVYRRSRFPLAVPELEDLFGLAPIQSLRVSAVSPSLPVLLSLSTPARLRRLELHSGSGGDGGGASLVLSSPCCSGLRELVMAGGVDDTTVAQIATSSRLAQLVALALWENPFGDRGAEALSASNGLGLIERLDLHNCTIGDAGAEALIGSRAFPRLDVLDLSGNPIGVPMRRALRERFGAVVRLG